MTKYPASTKLWKLVHTINGYHFELKLSGRIIATLPVPGDTIEYFKVIGLIKDEPSITASAIVTCQQDS